MEGRALLSDNNANDSDDGMDVGDLSSIKRSGAAASGYPAARQRRSGQWEYHHAIVFTLTFVSYMLVHASRKSFSNVKSLLEKEWTAFGDCPHGGGPGYNLSLYCSIEPRRTWRQNSLFQSSKESELFMGTLDTIFMFFYAIGLFISGILGDRLPLVFVLCVGMSVSSLSVFFFGCVTKWTGNTQPWLYGLLWAINGLAQSTCWPTIVAIMANWFGRKGRGCILGLWSANASVGNIVGALIVSSVLDFGSAVAFLVPSVMLLAGTLVNIFCLPGSPSDVNKIVPAIAAAPTAADLPHSHAVPLQTRTSQGSMAATSLHDKGKLFAKPKSHASAVQKQAIGFLEAWRLPGVLPYSLAYACLKLVNYSLFFWLPFYLTNSLHWPRTLASELSTLFDVGAIVGGTVGGLLSDFMGYRSPVFGFMLMLAVPFLFIYRQYGTGLVGNALLMLTIGFWIGGPANLLSAAISVDLGRQEALKGDTEALATVTGIIDGTGSIGAAAGQYLIGLIETQSGWQSVIYFLMIMLLLAVVCTSGLVYRETCQLFRRRWSVTHT